ncbi:hypothetical protein [Candidatus Laterigemmans baculatus]|uniref:hypothetical protein n=1 Tax=Candidatus Laterigemmans baculatus TaxID=2770505 RepID=UPI0013D9C66C|nr:hypothetical protein [Candidatus Laterigemmans baculatus]
MRPVLNRIAALTLLIGGLLTTGCCGPMLAKACRSGCGEVYVDPWINEPFHDPCGSCGNYNGQSCGSCRVPYAGVKTVWGYRYDSGCDSCDGCSSCGGGCDSCGGHEPNCGAEIGWGGEVGCGAEVTCGLETGTGSCSGCASCGGGSLGYVDTPVPYGEPTIIGESIIESDPHEAARVVMPEARRVYRDAPAPRRAPTSRPRQSRL